MRDDRDRSRGKNEAPLTGDASGRRCFQKFRAVWLSGQRIANARAPWRAACPARGVTRECVALSGLLCAAPARCTARRGRRGALTARAWLEPTADSGRINSAPAFTATLTELPVGPVFMVFSQSAYNAAHNARDERARRLRKQAA